MTYDDTLTLFRSLCAAHWDIAVKGKANPYTSMNGNMFSFLDKEGVLCVRLSKPDREAFNIAHGGGPVLQHGSVMKDYVALPAPLLDDPDALEIIFAASLAFAQSLPAKPTKRR